MSTKYKIPVKSTISNLVVPKEKGKTFQFSNTKCQIIVEDRGEDFCISIEIEDNVILADSVLNKIIKDGRNKV